MIEEERELRLTCEKILSVDDVGRLALFLRDRSRHRSGAERASAQLDELIVIALLLSGLRNSEFCLLALEDTIVVTGESVFNVRRPGARQRTVHVPRAVSMLVQNYVEQIRPSFLPTSVDPSEMSQPLVFWEHRCPFDRTSLYRRVVRILSEAGLGDRASVQLLRHTYGYLAYLRTGGNLLFVQRQLGHAHPRITSIYAQFVDESYADLAERVFPGARPTAELEKRVCVRRTPRFDCEID